MRLYLAGPMRGYENNNMAAFDRAAADLRSRGHEVWSPAEADALDSAGMDMRAYMKRDLPALLEQEAIVLLDGWNRSHGASLERHCADVVGMPVFLFEPKVDGGLVPVSTQDWRWRAVRESGR